MANKSFDESKYKIIKEYKIPDGVDSTSGLVVKLYSYDGCEPKLRLRRYYTNKENKIVERDDVKVSMSSLNSLATLLSNIQGAVTTTP